MRARSGLRREAFEAVDALIGYSRRVGGYVDYPVGGRAPGIGHFADLIGTEDWREVSSAGGFGLAHGS